ncbi:MAG TPA: PAS domain-containing sensor histidine kinase, partial [Gemmatimonadaceae bacterium]|nr:PAS domain-containing sensor histidine kinase [Gemmatimonadaceae bacterium]
QPLGLLMPSHLGAAHHAHVERFARSHATARQMADRGEIIGRRKDGSEFPAEASISKVEVNGQWIFTAVLRDITARRRAEEERAELLERERAARERAEAAERRALRALQTREEILGIVSHDLRDPLSAIGMCARALDGMPALDSEARDAVHTIGQATEWMQRMIRDLLDVASIEAGQLPVERRPEDMVILLVRASELFQRIAEEREITLTTQLPEHLPPMAVDGVRILQVLSNLLGNALKFVSRGGHVALRAALEGSTLHVTVTDDGPGIPESDLPRVFDRFWQSRRTSGVRGTGLGLAIARGIVEAHGGRIWIESMVGAGTMVHVVLPSTSEQGGSP